MKPWEDGTPRSTNNAFAVLYEKHPKTIKKSAAKKSAKPKPKINPKACRDTAGRLSTSTDRRTDSISIGPPSADWKSKKLARI